jgi:hypothetical protein
MVHEIAAPPALLKKIRLYQTNCRTKPSEVKHPPHTSDTEVKFRTPRLYTPVKAGSKKEAKKSKKSQISDVKITFTPPPKGIYPTQSIYQSCNGWNKREGKSEPVNRDTPYHRRKPGKGSVIIQRVSPPDNNQNFPPDREIKSCKSGGNLKLSPTRQF